MENTVLYNLRCSFLPWLSLLADILNNFATRVNTLQGSWINSGRASWHLLGDHLRLLERWEIVRAGLHRGVLRHKGRAAG